MWDLADREFNLQSANIATLAFPCFDGCYLPKQENEFVHTVLHELDAYLQREKRKSALLFPPLSSRLRYLIHKTTENHRNLATFSVGEGWSRRVVVCYSHLRLDLGDESNTDSFYNEAPKRGMWMQSSRTDLQPRPKPLAQRSGGNAKRPDKAIYVPRAARDRSSNLHGPPAGVDLNLPLPTLSFTSSGCTSTSESCSCYSSDTTEGTLSETQANTNQDSVPSNTTTSSAGQEDDFIRFSAEEPCPRPPAWDQTVSYFMALTMEDQTREAQEEEEHVAEEVRTEESSVGSSIVTSHQHHASDTTPAKDAASDAADFSQEIKAHLTETDVAIEHAHNDYSCFENVWINQDEFAHVIEIYDFPAMFKTGDLLDAFADYSDEGMKIKWVDNTHALGVFSSQSAALHALSIQHPLLKTCTLSDGSKKAKGKAIRRAEFIQPVKERPRTDSAVARRMVSRALGVQRGGMPSQRF
ncbi:R3H and coiled-coil domain-containing protein 1 isoform X1 [Salvelinus fontinalis]|uniref:R3H and coiled-coil domain-containing protein 1 isoform X1 n=1 Tax=Salvelinus fontinalis TaxID=8038 RepID=UPI002484FA03|nr:R3H and coiled-coil domain-containing protein 1 isoform X1 [Salvelinus fontinalis]